MKNSLSIVWKYVQRFLVILILVFAVLMSLARALTPLLNHYPEQLKTLANRSLRHPIQFERVEAVWSRWGPSLKFSNVKMWQQENTDKPALLTVPLLELQFNVFTSLIERRLIPHEVSVSGMELVLRQTPDATWLLEGLGDIQTLPNLKNFRLRSNKNDIPEWLTLLLHERRLAIRNANINVILASGREYPFEQVAITLVNRVGHHHLRGLVNLKQTKPSQLKFALDIEGNPLDSGPDVEWDARSYLQVKNLWVDQWLKDFSWRGFRADNGWIDLSVWTTWKNGELISVKNKFAIKQFMLRALKNPVFSFWRLDDGRGVISWDKSSEDDGRWTLRGDRMNLQINGFKWPKTAFRFEVGNSRQNDPAQYNLQLQYVRLQDLVPLTSLIGKLPETWQTALSKLDPQGELKDLFLNYQLSNEDAPEHLTLDVVFNDIGFKAWNALPGMQGLTGHLNHSADDTGHADLESRDVAFSIDKVFRDPLLFDDIEGRVTWERDASGWVIKSEELSAENTDGIVDAQLSLTLPNDFKNPSIDLLADFKANTINKMNRYLPARVLPKLVVEWLDRAIRSVESGEGRVLLRGPLNDFPFDQETGIFILKARAKGVDVAYWPQWPMVRNLEGDLLFRNRRMEVDINRGDISGVEIQNGRVVIEKMAEDMTSPLTIQGQLIGDLSQGMQYLRESPFSTVGDDVLREVDLRGPMTLSLDLTIPFKKKDPFQYQLDLMTQAGVLQFPQWGFVLDRLDGKIHVDDKKGISAKGIKARWLNSPVSIGISTSMSSAEPSSISPISSRSLIDQLPPWRIQIDMLGRLRVKDVEKRYGMTLSPILSGDLPYQAQLYLSDVKEVSQRLLIRSDLKGLTIDLPSPFKKAGKEVQAFQANAVFHDNGDIYLTADLPSKGSGVLVLRGKEGQIKLTRGTVHLGEGKAVLQKQHGLAVTGRLQDVSLLSWYEFMTTAQHPSMAILDELIRADLDIDRLDLFGQHLRNVQLSLEPQATQYMLDVLSPLLAGRVFIPKDPTQQALRLKLQHWYLEPVEPHEEKTRISFQPTDLPAMEMEIDDLRYNKKHLGKTYLQIQPEKDALLIKDLSATSRAFDLKAKGEWRTIDSATTRTRLTGNVTTKNLAASLKYWNLTPAIDSEDASMNFNLYWQGAPYSAKLENMNVFVMRGIGILA